MHIKYVENTKNTDITANKEINIKENATKAVNTGAYT